MVEPLLEKDGLLQAFRSGERAALAEVYRAHVQQVAELVRRGFHLDRTSRGLVPGVLSPAGQCDLVQETFTRAFAEPARRAYDGRSPYRWYLLRIAKNLMIDGLRRQGRESPLAEVGEGDEPALAPEDPALEAHRGRQQALAGEFTAGLTGEERQVFEARFQAGLGQLETAERLGLTRRRVRTLEARLLASLRKRLKRSNLWP